MHSTEISMLVPESQIDGVRPPSPIPPVAALFARQQSQQSPPPPPPTMAQLAPNSVRMPLLLDGQSAAASASLANGGGGGQAEVGATSAENEPLLWHSFARVFRFRGNLKNLRISCIMIGLYYSLIAHFALFVMLMSLVHAEQMFAYLDTDIADHKEREGYYDMPMHASGVTVNTLRFGFAADLAATTRNLICVGLALVVAYAVCCALMLYGVIRYRAGCMMPWLVMQGCGVIVAFGVTLVYRQVLIEAMCGYVWTFWVAFWIFRICDIMFWFVVHEMFCTLLTANKLTVSATVAIPYAKKGKIPYHFCKENMYLGSGGHKHTLTDRCDPNYVV